MNKGQQVIMNADDFGHSEEYNSVVMKAFRKGIITSATLMTNMPFFGPACEVAKAEGFDDHLGLHFNLTYGRPLTAELLQISEICNEDGEFDFRLPRHRLVLPARIRSALEGELAAQWQACLDQGIRPTHIDSHQHVHNMLPIAGLVARFAAQKGVPVRLARNIGKNISLPKALYKGLVNRRIKRYFHTPVNYVCTPADLCSGAQPEGVVEVVCHPRLLACGGVGDDYLPANMRLHEVWEQFIDKAQRVSYATIRRQGLE